MNVKVAVELFIESVSEPIRVLSVVNYDQEIWLRHLNGSYDLFAKSCKCARKGGNGKKQHWKSVTDIHRDYCFSNTEVRPVIWLQRVS